ncbi:MULTISPECIES: alpha/beta fold hydrolase [Chryseobacterium]|uniref:Esterase/lipase superfamily enzyme n=1 Tax=Chryseobacterium camelliae TaxID=1265445 RepID=A0ABU0TJK5_9FLAO|nr:MULTISPECIES: alpha/beta fold hydrolase [Chryseobacterium]MDT3405801.1 esterase/lipase superfamily enzyme [Pseudacidovorax intermedius]MDQ1096393.1 esterase/lipase superfamily enzyme [Chryseobacterium camelliae]MDQ1100333.1 esterase/lipase superfamily enzyme [Chryseobacterium sp. SORGH_AS_1048]MDR6087675.1 esterase/lipase superfamily enzyme [Chryseobacterium sp. SORGH_AS_0909]MDR6132050.1 esterase/lipase superfamily enzyme [Chryseobacterium sp. SORGH_AS_1175]
MPHIEHSDYYSHILNMHVPVEITGHYGYPVIMFPTSQGSYTQNNDFHLNGSVNWLIEQGKIKLYNIQTIDSSSFYDNNIPPQDRIRNYERYIQFLIQEFVPYIQKLHQTHRIAVAGASFGGYHAANFAFRFPDLVSHLICLSGAFSIRNFMDGYSDDLVYFNCPNEFVKNDAAWKYKHMHIVLSTSDQDICRDKNIEMAEILRSKGIDFWYDERKWISHDWPLWRMVFPMFMGRFFS